MVNTSTTIITFLMVFILQNTQNRDSEALHAKLDELILVGKAKNTFVGAENLTDDQLEKMRELVKTAADQPAPTPSRKRRTASGPNK